VKIVLNDLAKKQLSKTPDYIYRKYLYWINLISVIGIREARKHKGYHDEPLKGERFGQRSIRLSRSYRLIYRQTSEGQYEIIEVLEVNKHEGAKRSTYISVGENPTCTKGSYQYRRKLCI
jgi:proteic killer suppression protein